MADVDAQLNKIKLLFGDDLESLGEMGRPDLINDVYESLLIMFSLTDSDLSLDGYTGDKNAIRAKSQGPYLAMAHLLVALSNPVVPEEV